MEEKHQLTMLIAHLLALDEDAVLDNRREVRESIERGPALRSEIDNCSVAYFQEYLDEKERLLVEVEKAYLDNGATLLEREYKYSSASDMLNYCVYEFMLKYKAELEKLNYYAWAKFLEQINDDNALVKKSENP